MLHFVHVIFMLNSSTRLQDSKLRWCYYTLERSGWTQIPSNKFLALFSLLVLLLLINWTCIDHLVTLFIHSFIHPSIHSVERLSFLALPNWEEISAYDKVIRKVWRLGGENGQFQHNRIMEGACSEGLLRVLKQTGVSIKILKNS